MYGHAKGVHTSTLHTRQRKRARRAWANNMLSVTYDAVDTVMTERDALLQAEAYVEACVAALHSAKGYLLNQTGLTQQREDVIEALRTGAAAAALYDLASGRREAQGLPGRQYTLRLSNYRKLENMLVEAFAAIGTREGRSVLLYDRALRMSTLCRRRLQGDLEELAGQPMNDAGQRQFELARKGVVGETNIHPRDTGASVGFW